MLNTPGTRVGPNTGHKKALKTPVVDCNFYIFEEERKKKQKSMC